MNFLKNILIALAPTVLDWGFKKARKVVFEVVQYFKYNKKEKNIIKKKLKREDLTKQIDIATNKGDDEETKKLYIALHLLDSDN